MASAAAYRLIHDHLVAHWTKTPLFFENDGQDLQDLPGSPASFVAVEMFATAFDQQSLGSGAPIQERWLEAGVLMLHVMAPKGAGTFAARTLAIELVDLFRGQTIGTMRFRHMTLGAGDPHMDDGSWFAMTVTIDWERLTP